MNLIKFIRTHLILNIIFLSLLVLGWFFIIKPNSQKNKIAKENIATVERKNLKKTISASGKVKAEKEVTLKFQTSGYLTWVGVKEGDPVKAWQAVAQLDTRELERRLLKGLRDYSKERWDFEEDKEVTYKDKIITDTAKRILEKNQFDLDKAVADVEIADIALQFSTLISSIDGIVTALDTPFAGVNITPATASIVVSDPNSVYFQADVDETDIGSIKNEQKVLIALDAYPDEEISGSIYFIGFSSTTTSGGGNAYSIKIKMPENINLKFKLGMNGDAEIILAEKKSVLVVPTSVLRKEKGKYYVTTLVNDTQVKKYVQTGLETDDEVEIKDGLQEGDKILLDTK